MVEEKTIQKENTNESTEKVRNLILFNDDFNTFEFVIETLIDVCKHEPEQAEQCTFILKVSVLLSRGVLLNLNLSLQRCRIEI